jgi:hypothetical protein
VKSFNEALYPCLPAGKAGHLADLAARLSDGEGTNPRIRSRVRAGLEK